MKSKTQLFIDNHHQLTNYWYKLWKSNIVHKLPQNMLITEAELDSEITAQCIYLAQLFKTGSYVAYCNEFVEKRVITHFWKEYSKLDHDAIADAYAEFDDDYRNAYTQNHQYGEYTLGEYTTIDKEIENRDTLQEINKMTYDKIERKIIMMILDGLTYEEIAQRLGISKMDITRRMRAVGQRYREQEEKNA